MNLLLLATPDIQGAILDNSTPGAPNPRLPKGTSEASRESSTGRFKGGGRTGQQIKSTGVEEPSTLVEIQRGGDSDCRSHYRFRLNHLPRIIGLASPLHYQ
jgi:hypothetical protein